MNILVVGPMMLKAIKENCKDFEKSLIETDDKPYVAGRVNNYTVICNPNLAPETVYTFENSENRLDDSPILI